MKEIVHDRRGNEIYLTDEWWAHIIETHEDMSRHRERLLRTVRTGRRRQDPLDPSKYKSTRSFDDLPADYTHIVVVVKFETKQGPQGVARNNFVLTAYQISRIEW